MVLPIGDTPNPRNYTAWVNWGLIAMNVAVYLLFTMPMSGAPADANDPLLAEYLKAMAMRLGLSSQAEVAYLFTHTSSYDVFTFAHGYKPGAPAIGDLFFSLFLHAGFLHLAGNMLFLWIFGDNVEHRLGRLRYLAAYLLTGVAATLTFALFEGDSMMPLVGASGAISGVMGLYFVMFPRNKVKVLLFLFIFIDVVLVPARWVLAFYILAENLLPYIYGNETGIAYGAHIGGFGAGLALAWGGRRLAWKLPMGGARKPGEAPPAEGGKGVKPLAGLQSAIARGDDESALAWMPVLERGDVERLEPAQCAVLAAWVQDSGKPAAATRILKRCLAAHPGSEDLARVYLALGLLRLSQGQQAAAYQHLLSVMDHDPDPETRGRALAALEKVDMYQKKPKGEA